MTQCIGLECNDSTDKWREEDFIRGRNKYYKTRELRSRNYNVKVLLRNAE